MGTNTYTGPTTVVGGTLLVNNTHSGTGNFTVKTGATLGGNGTIAAPVVVEAGGALSPGTSAGILTVASLNLLKDSVFDIEIGGATAGTQFDRLNSTGVAMLKGTLRVSRINNFVFAENNTFDILNASSIQGTFDLLDLPPLNGALAWDTSLLYATGRFPLSKPSSPAT